MLAPMWFTLAEPPDSHASPEPYARPRPDRRQQTRRNLPACR
jgi:hypothetical protein